MIKITIFCIGKFNANFYRDGEKEFLKRLSRFCKVSVTELPEYRMPAKPYYGDIAKCLETEGAMILSKIPQGAYVVSMCIEGEKMKSEQFAKKIISIEQETSHIVFVIGSSHGLADSVKEKSNLLLSMSEMTFPHNLARILILEQIYRAYCINSGHPYHK